ncbi:hypothetical protein GYMLUDRAFT_821049 [Collybiopsis luxurians FD-317 M1]|uniref:Uncharacterized protein n=1 Tax=Collybiopsis luxurians FD-317 M1 TaxID=944289 RepID=A0A0D0CEJ8_9AGAR|nr:hypothetical protein GYMLUDRAFT_821049 [Collybiopsis luxurians FD-317 M1]
MNKIFCAQRAQRLGKRKTVQDDIATPLPPQPISELEKSDQPLLTSGNNQESLRGDRKEQEIIIVAPQSCSEKAERIRNTFSPEFQLL